VQTNINQIIKERRSIYPKEFNGQIVNESVVDVLLENANFAPNHKTNYPWRFVVIKGDALHRFINKAAAIYKDYTQADKFSESKYQKTLDYTKSVSHAIAIVLHRGEEDNTIFVEDVSATAAAVQNMYLSLHQFDQVGGYWSTGLGTYSKDMHDFLQLGNEEMLMGFFVLGCVDNKRTLGNRKNYKQFVREL
jgi:nitroreductase